MYQFLVTLFIYNDYISLVFETFSSRFKFCTVIGVCLKNVAMHVMVLLSQTEQRFHLTAILLRQLHCK